ncbi:UNVERIFIED_CONTAM: hypothetical protein Sindi_1266700 [Sesamum indicum]
MGFVSVDWAAEWVWVLGTEWVWVLGHKIPTYRSNPQLKMNKTPQLISCFDHHKDWAFTFTAATSSRQLVAIHTNGGCRPPQFDYRFFTAIFINMVPRSKDLEFTATGRRTGYFIGEKSLKIEELKYIEGQIQTLIS